MDGLRILTVEEVDRAERIVAELGDRIAELHPVGAWLSACPCGGCGGEPVIVQEMSMPGVLLLFSAGLRRGPDLIPVLRWHFHGGRSAPTERPAPFVFLPKDARGEGGRL